MDRMDHYSEREPGGVSGEELLQRLPIMLMPAGIERVVFAGGEADVIEDQRRFSGAGFEFKANNRIDPGVPVPRAPGLHDALAGDQFDIAAGDEAAEHGERSAGGGVNGGRHAGEGGELLLVENGVIEPLRAGLEVDLVVNRCESL